MFSIGIWILAGIVGWVEDCWQMWSDHNRQCQEYGWDIQYPKFPCQICAGNLHQPYLATVYQGMDINLFKVLPLQIFTIYCAMIFFY